MRRNINMAIVFVSTIIAIILHTTFIAGILPIIPFFLAFNIICLLYYRESRLIIAYHVTMIFFISGYYVYFGQLINDDGLLTLFRAFMDFGSLIILLISFVLTFTSRIKKFVPQGLLIIAIWAFVFYSSTTLVITGYIAAIVGPNPFDIEQAIMAFRIVGIVIWGLLGFLQIYLIAQFDRSLKRKNYRAQKRVDQINEMYY